MHLVRRDVEAAIELYGCLNGRGKELERLMRERNLSPSLRRRGFELLEQADSGSFITEQGGLLEYEDVGKAIEMYWEASFYNDIRAIRSLSVLVELTDYHLASVLSQEAFLSK